MNANLSNVRARTATAVCAATAVGLAAGVAMAGDPVVSSSIVLRGGDTLPGLGTLTMPADVWVNNNGDWVVTYSMSSPSGTVIVTNDGVFVASGEEIAPGMTTGSLTNLLKHMNNNGDFVFRPTIVDMNSGFFLNDTPLIMHSDVSTSPDFTDPTPYIGFFRGRITDSDLILMVATVDDPVIPSSVDRALVWLTVDEISGDVIENVLAKETDVLPGQVDGALDFGTGSEAFSLNQNGQPMFTVSLPGSSAAMYIEDTLIATRGDFGPFKDVTYNFTHSTARVDLNNHGEFVFYTTLAGGPTDSNNVILRGDLSDPGEHTVVKRKGDPAPGTTEGETIIGFGTGAGVFVTNVGQVVHYAQLSGDTTTNQAIYVDDEIVLRKGVSTVDGTLITNFGTTSSSNGIGNTLAVSEDGNYLIVRAVLDGGDRAVVLVELDAGTCVPADLDCNGSVGVGDLLILLNQWGSCLGCSGDLNDDGMVNVGDMLILLSQWG